MAEDSRRSWACSLGLVLATVLLTCAGVSGARAQSVERAQTLYLGADFEAARGEVRTILTSETATRDELIAALRILVALESMLGTPEALAEAARSLAALDPTALAAEGAPETANEAVVLARQAPPPRVRVTTRGTTATAVSEGAPSIAVALALNCSSPSSSRGSVDPSARSTSVELEGTERTRCTAELRAAGGVVLAVGGEERLRAPAGALTAGSTAVGTNEEVLWIALGVGGGVLLVGVLIGVGVATSSPGNPSFGSPVVIGW